MNCGDEVWICLHIGQSLFTCIFCRKLKWFLQDFKDLFCNQSFHTALEPVSFDSYTIRYFMLLIMFVLKTRFLLQLIEILKKSTVDWYELKFIQDLRFPCLIMWLHKWPNAQASNTLFPFSSVAGPQFKDREHCKQVKAFPEKITFRRKQVFMHV